MMKTPLRSCLWFTGLCGLVLVSGVHAGPKPRVLVDLPLECNTPDGCTLDAAGGIILSVPNFNNERLVEAGLLKQPAPTPISPPSGPVQWLFQGPPAESKLLAVQIHPFTNPTES